MKRETPDRIGPFDHLVLCLPQSGVPFQVHGIRDRVVRFTEDGIGVAINPSPMGVDWVFTCGDLLTLCLRLE